ncbi:MAG: bifunctional folylpolyglutamate synthase/dihydrofolate synthase [Butyricicoccus sp.]
MKQYEQSLADIHSHGRFSGTAGLHRITALMAALGDPHKRLKFVHIAGTNGKGSTAALTAAALEQAGYKTGLFTSPYVLDFCERIQINRTWVSQETLCELCERVMTAEKTLVLPEGEHIGEFEFTTAMAMVYFAEQNCDIVVLEVGLGGRYDATNVIDAPEVAVMTHVALDHMAVLGNTPKEIAADKSYIVKPGSVLVSAPAQTEDVLTVLRQRCEQVGAQFVKTEDPIVISSTLRGGKCRYKGIELYTKMVGTHQLDNLCTACEVISQLNKRGWNIPDSARDAGFSQASMPARQEVVSEEPLILIDGAHNPDGIHALCATLDELLPPGGISFLFGMVDDKQYQQCVQMLARRADNVYTITPDTPRAIPSSVLASCIREFSPYTNAFDCGDLRSALRRARASAGEDDVIVICGSLYVAAEAEKLLRGDKNRL